MRCFEVVTSRELDFLNAGMVLPNRGTYGSAGYDFFLPAEYEGAVIKPNRILKVNTYVKVTMPRTECLLLFIRSSLAKKGIVLATGVSVIDSDYYNNPDNEGEIIAYLKNTDPDHPFILEGGMRFMQGVFIPFWTTDDDFCDGIRTGGTGSTGV